MGMWSDWYEKNAGKETCLTNAEFVLKAIDKAFNSAIDKLYPVGSIYISVNNTNPGIYLTGTIWTAWGSGRVPVGVDTGQTEFNAVEKTGGEKAHTLTTAEMPSHSHTQQGSFNTTNNGGHAHTYTAPILYEGDATASEKGGEVGEESRNTSSNGSHTHSVTISDDTKKSGSGDTHNNLQPFITCYMWKRIT